MLHKKDTFEPGSLLLRSATFQLIGLNPAAVAQIASIVFHISWMNVAAAIIIIIGGFNINAVILIYMRDRRMKKQILEFLNNFPGCKHEAIAIELNGFKKAMDIVKRIFNEDLDMSFFPILFARLTRPRIKVFFIHLGGNVLPATPTAFPMMTGRGCIFLTQRPEKMNSILLFHFFHEVGHLSIGGKLINELNWYGLTNFFLLFVSVAIHHEAGTINLLVSLMLVALHAYYFFQTKDQRNERVELFAETFALVHLYLAKRPDFRTAVARIARKF